MKRRVLINAANIHSGGAVQVATSFIEELVSMNELDFNIVVSNEINKELKKLCVNTNLFKSYIIYDVYGFTVFFDLNFNKMLKNYELIFTIFGPLYTLKKPKKSIVGFAQPWIIYPENEIYLNFSFFNKIISRFKYFVQKFFFFRADEIIVELEHVKSKLKSFNFTKNIHVVHNCIASIFNNKDKWVNNFHLPAKKETRLGILSRDYPHKNLKILPIVAEILKNKFNFKIKFLVTFTSDEWEKRDKNFHKYVENLGSLDINQCPSFYNLIDGLIFPSLLECFSATPIEAMIMKKPVFASNRLFVRQVCKECAVYFDPNNIDDIASKIYIYFSKDRSLRKILLDKSYLRALNFNNPNKRAQKYVKIITNNLV